MPLVPTARGASPGVTSVSERRVAAPNQRVPLLCHFVDEYLLVLEKPSGLLCVPGRGPDKQDCLSARALQTWGDALVVHRLDQPTSGLVLMARSAAVQRVLSLMFEQRQVVKLYCALVHGRPLPQDPFAAQRWSTIDLPIAADWPRRPLRVIDPGCGKPSQTLWRAVGNAAPDGTSRLHLQPITGRTHQLRVHLSAIGHSILGDALYGNADSAPRLMLHASALAFRHPMSGDDLHFESTVPF